MPTIGSLEVRLLGGFRVLVDGEPVDEPAWVRRKSKTLVKLLALEPAHEMPSDQLVELLWPETEPQLAQNNLHKTIHAARRALEPALKDGPASRFVATQDQKIKLGAQGGIRVDAVEFESRATKALASKQHEDLQAALALYTGELLPEDRYEDWSAVQRERLAKLHQDLLLELAAHAEAMEQWPRAIELLQKLVAADPCNENAHRRLMRLHARAGNRHLALQQYRQCQETLRRELEVDVEPATRQLYEQIQAGGGAVARESPVRQQEGSVVPVAARAPSPRAGKFLPLMVLALLAVAALGWWWSRSGTGREIHSLAVLPFTAAEPLSYLSDGITESVINSLSGLSGLRVMARSTVFTYKDKIADPREAGRKIGVRAVVIGRVVQRGTSIAVSVELVDVSDGAQLWGQQYTLDSTTLASAQSRISSELAAALRLKLGADQRQRMAQPPTASPAAYRNYLLGRYHSNKRTKEALLKATEYFKQAAAEDPSFAQAYTGLADANGLLGFNYGAPTDYFPAARAAVSKALELDNQSAEAYTSLGMIKALYDWDWPAAETAYRKAISLNPGHATAHHWFGVHLNAMGRYEEARAELAHALELDPLSPIINSNAAYPDHYQRRYDPAIRQYRKTIELDPAFVVAHEDLGLALEQTQRYDEALNEILAVLRIGGDVELVSEIERLKPRGPVDSSTHHRLLARLGERLVARFGQRFVAPMDIAQFFSRAGDRARALEWLERAYNTHDVQLVYLKVDPQYDSLRGTPQFDQLLQRLRLL